MNYNKECVEIVIEMTLKIMQKKTIFGLLSKNGCCDAFDFPVYNPSEFRTRQVHMVCEGRERGFMRWEKHKNKDLEKDFSNLLRRFLPGVKCRC